MLIKTNSTAPTYNQSKVSLSWEEAYYTAQRESLTKHKYQITNESNSKYQDHITYLQSPMSIQPPEPIPDLLKTLDFTNEEALDFWFDGPEIPSRGF